MKLISIFASHVSGLGGWQDVNLSVPDFYFFVSVVLERQPHKMVKYTQQLTDELLECCLTILWDWSLTGKGD